MNFIKSLISLTALATISFAAKAVNFTVSTGDFIKNVSVVEGMTTLHVNSLFIDNEADMLYCGAGAEIFTIDVKNPLKPEVLSSVKVYGLIRQITVQNGILYAACREAGVYIVDVSNPRNIKLITRYDPIELATGIEVAGDVLFLGTRMNGVECVDVSNPENPTHICIEKTGESQSVTYRDGVLYSGEWGPHCITVMDAADMAHFKALKTVGLKGYGDGVWTYGDYLYVATGHHLTAPERPFEERMGLGNGFELFDISDPLNPKFLSKCSFDKLHWRNNDYWTPRPMSGGKYTAVANTANGLYIINTEDPYNSRIIDRINFKRNDGSPVSVTSVAVGKGVIYASVFKDNGLMILECPEASPVVKEKGKAPENASYRHPYPTAASSHFTAWKPSKYSPVRGVAVYGDYLFAACSYGGLAILRMEDGRAVKFADGPMSYAGDVKVRGNRLYVAEGFEGLAVYEIGEGMKLKELARFNKFSDEDTQPACLWVFVPDDKHIVASSRYSGYYYLDASDFSDIRIIKKLGNDVPGWDKYVADKADKDGWYPRMSHQRSVTWLNLNDPDLKETRDSDIKPSLYDGICAFRDNSFISASQKKIYITRHGDINSGKDGKSGDFNGMPSWDGKNRVALTYRCFKQISMVDMSDEKNPKLLWKENTCGYPETATFWKGRLAVPCGYQGLLLEKRSADNTLSLKMLPGEKWWGGISCFDRVPMTPYGENTTATLDLLAENYSNQAVPFFVSSKGRYIWSDDPFTIKFSKGEMKLKGDSKIELVEAGTTLREAYLAASAKHFPSSGEIPAEEFITNPQYNTWIELTYNQNQKDILAYARAICDNGFPSNSVFMIDDNWQKYYGNFDFKPERFPDPKAMCDELHKMGFKVMVWACPFISADSPEYRFLAKKGYLVKKANEDEPYICKWWNGYSGVVDMSNPEARAWFVGTLRATQEKYGVDGFKLDAGDAPSYPKNEVSVYDGKSVGTNHSELWADLYRDFPYHEFRACWKKAGQPVVQRLQDKDYSWEGVGLLIPSILSASMEGHQFVCPDMIGGGQFTKFQSIDESKFDQDLIVRSCQIHAFMPMMQFSVAPWRILNKKNLEICRKYACLHKEMSPYLMEQARKCAKSGEPIVRPLEYAFPGEGFEDCHDQYMLGDKYLVTPMVGPGYSRVVRLPKGQWVDEQGKKYKGGKEYTLDVPIERVPYFVKTK